MFFLECLREIFYNIFVRKLFVNSSLGVTMNLNLRQRIPNTQGMKKSAEFLLHLMLILVLVLPQVTGSTPQGRHTQPMKTT